MDKLKNIEEKLKESGFSGRILFEEPLKNHTTMKVGGKAACFVLPSDENSLCLALRLAESAGIRKFVLGGGSNLIFADEGFEGIVICTDEFREIRISDQENYSLTCDAGVKTSRIAEFCLENFVQGFESFSGLPGSIGGACFMNARCYEDEISNHVKVVRYLDLKKNEICSYDFKREDWSYKISPFQDEGKVVLSVEICGLKKLDRESEEFKKAKVQAESFLKNREEKGHFKSLSAGSVFKNNRSFGKPSGVLIDEAGLKGTSVGGAQVAPWHGNFIINNGNASSADIKALVKLVQEKVMQKTGFLLEPEVIFVD